MRQEIVNEHNHRGDIVEKLLTSHEELLQTPEGQLFQGFNQQLQLYLGELGSDNREQQRLRLLLEKLKPHGIVSEIDPQDQIIIRPIIVHLANLEKLLALPETATDEDEVDSADEAQENP